MEATYIQFDETHRIEVMPSGNHYPEYLSNTERWCYYKLNANKVRSFKTENGARKFLSTVK
jgi:hypothetical protein